MQDCKKIYLPSGNEGTYSVDTIYIPFQANLKIYKILRSKNTSLYTWSWENENIILIGDSKKLLVIFFARLFFQPKKKNRIG